MSIPAGVYILAFLPKYLETGKRNQKEKKKSEGEKVEIIN